MVNYNGCKFGGGACLIPVLAQPKTIAFEMYNIRGVCDDYLSLYFLCFVFTSYVLT